MKAGAEPVEILCIGRDAAAIEVVEELPPFGVCGGAGFLAGTGGAAAGDEGAVALISSSGYKALYPDPAVHGDASEQCFLLFFCQRSPTRSKRSFHPPNSR